MQAYAVHTKTRNGDSCSNEFIYFGKRLRKDVLTMSIYVIYVRSLNFNNREWIRNVYGRYTLFYANAGDSGFHGTENNPDSNFHKERTRLCIDRKIELRWLVMISSTLEPL